MTANELADWIKNNAPYNQYETAKQAVIMLRQQQAELDAFKLNYYNMGYSLQLRDKDETIRQQEQKIAELEKDLFMLQKHYDQLGVRELTDEEIIDAWEKFPNWGHEQHIVMFGKELLKKAREK
jgi:hypothetical protein